MFATKSEKLGYMIDLIYMVMDEQGIRCENGHWMTDEKGVSLFIICFIRNEYLED